MASPRVRSVNVGRGVAVEYAVAEVTGIDKSPVASVQVRAPGSRQDGAGSGVVGDVVGDRRNHGGDQQAVYAVAREEMDAWERELGRELPDGCFGENLTLSDLDVDAAVIGQRWRVGEEVVLEVCGPRIPCRTFAGFLRETGWVTRFAERGRPGAYCSVVTPGTIRPGDPVAVGETPAHGLDVRQVFRAFMGDLDAADAVLEAGCLHPEYHAELAGTVQRRRRTG